ncbi:integrase [Acetoanaerobium pronyense]|uniref:Integrase n=1 Tax=Acetoanaerobium pronyense TaxID=1482736 RepID=A0ABS4KL32_9FIRM|nr:site-specific integrase [Acetoanaerobium pronyense]MBP2028497.1 integrase [Acetoanaerobium pronyense]
MRKFIYAVDFFDYWLRIKNVECAESTVYGYKNILYNHFIPYFHNVKIKDITSIDLEEYFEHILHKKYRGKNLTRHTASKHYGLLNQAFKKMKQLDVIKKNPMKKVMKPVDDKVMVYSIYTADKIFNLLDILDGMKIDIPVCLAGFLGLRRGEVAGLKWKNVFFDQRYIQIKDTKTVVGCNIIQKDSPKSKSAVRKIYLPDFILFKLKREYIRQKEITLKTGVEFEYVMQWDCGKEFRPNYISNCLKETLEKHSLPHIRFHDLRHSFASIANENRVSLHDISLALGHSEERTTSKIYIHTFDDYKKSTVLAVYKNIMQENSKKLNSAI